MRKSSFSSLRVRLVILVLLAIVPALVLTLYSGLVQRRQARSDALNSALELTEKASDDQDGLIERTRQLLVALAHYPDPEKWVGRS